VRRNDEAAIGTFHELKSAISNLVPTIARRGSFERLTPFAFEAKAWHTTTNQRNKGKSKAMEYRPRRREPQ